MSDDFRSDVMGRVRAALGMVEDRPGTLHKGAIVRASLGGCVRRGLLLGIPEGLPWCAAFVGLSLFQGDAAAALRWNAAAFLGGEVKQPVGWRAAVSELVVDAEASGVLHSIHPGDLAPGERPWAPGDLMIFGRNGENPLAGGFGHVAFVDELLEDSTETMMIGGDTMGSDPPPVGYGVRRTALSKEGHPPLAWVSLTR